MAIGESTVEEVLEVVDFNTEGVGGSGSHLILNAAFVSGGGPNA